MLQGASAAAAAAFAGRNGHGISEGQLTLMIEDDRPSSNWSHTRKCRPSVMVVVGVEVEEEEETE
jgi:hypothetical protein